MFDAPINSAKFGITLAGKKEEPFRIAMENPLFNAKNFKMPKPGSDGNPFGGEKFG